MGQLLESARDVLEKHASGVDVELRQVRKWREGGFSALARLYYLARPTKTAMPYYAGYIFYSVLCLLLNSKMTFRF